MKEVELLSQKDFKVVDTLGHIVNRVAIILRKKLTEQFKDQGVELTPEEFAVISRLWEEDGLFQAEITEKTLKNKSRVTRLIGGLVKKSFVYKQIDESDRRNFRIFLTDKGSRLRYKVLPMIMALMDQASHQIAPADLAVTIKTLKNVLTNINNDNYDQVSKV